MSPNNPSLPQFISILVNPDHLSTTRDTGLQKLNWLQRFNPFRGKQRVKVEALPYLAKDSIFYVPFSTSSQNAETTPVQFAHVSSNQVDNLVQKGDKFEVSFAGMSITPQDMGPSGKNELLLYSVTNDVDDEEKDETPVVSAKRNKISARFSNVSEVSSMSTDEDSAAATPAVVVANKSITQTVGKQAKPSPSTFLTSLAAGLPYIHYDPVFDAPSGGDEPDTFVPVPASKSLYHRSSSNNNVLNKLFVKFRVMEIDAEAESQLQAMSQVAETTNASLGSIGKKTLPHYEAISGALKVAGSVGKTSLKELSKPDHVFSRDVEFKLLSEKRNVGSPQKDCFLRYGYYFFLNKRIDAKLYAPTSISSQNIPLLLHRVRTEQEKKNGCLEYFPLTGVSYVVVKVSKGCENEPPAEWDKIRQMHKRRLDRMLTMPEVKNVVADGKTPTKKNIAKKK